MADTANLLVDPISSDSASFAVNSNDLDVTSIDGDGEERGGEGNQFGQEEEAEHKPISFLDAIVIPGVAEYSFSYAFLKLVNYSLFFWLPYYLKNGLGIGESSSDLLSNLYDIGQIFGGIGAGFISDRMGYRSPVTVLFLIISIPLLGLFTLATTKFHVSLLLFVSGFFIGGPANMISSAISADLGTHPTLRGNDKALGTVTGIVDGTGSVGAAIGQQIVSRVSTKVSWSAVFVILMVMTLLSAVCIFRMLYRDLKALTAKRSHYETILDT